MSDISVYDVLARGKTTINDGLALHICFHSEEQQLCLLHKTDDASNFSHAKHLNKLIQLLPKQQTLLHRRFKLRVAQISFLVGDKLRRIKHTLYTVHSSLRDFKYDSNPSSNVPYTLYQHKILSGIDDSLKHFDEALRLGDDFSATLKNSSFSHSQIFSPSYMYLSERILLDLIKIKQHCDSMICLLIELRLHLLNRKCDTDVTFVTFTNFHLYRLLNMSKRFINSRFFSEFSFLTGIPRTRLKYTIEKFFNDSYGVNHFIDNFVRSRYEFVTRKLIRQTKRLFSQLYYENTQIPLDENGNPIKKLSENDDSISTMSMSSNGKSISEAKLACKLLRKTYLKLFNDEKTAFTSLLLEISDICKMLNKDHATVVHKENGTNGTNNTYSAISSKYVDWMKPIDAKQKINLSNYFEENLWSKVCESVFQLYVRESLLEKDNYTADVNTIAHPRNRRDVIWKTKLKLTEDGRISQYFLHSLAELIMAVTMMDDLQMWDAGMCNVMSLSLKDHFRHKKESISSPSSITIRKALTNQPNIQDILKVLNRSKMTLFQQRRRQVQLDVLFSLHAFINFFRVILPSRRQLYLSSASWEPFFVVSSLDLKIVVLYMGRLLQNLKTLFPTIESEDAILFQYFEECLAFEERSFNLLVHNMSNRFRQLFKQNMPNTKTWRRRGSSVSVYEPNSFVTVAFQSLFSPFLEASTCLQRLVMMRILSRCVTSFLKVWMEHLLDEQVIFSLFGCQQLLFDLQFFLQSFENENFGLSVDEVSDIHSLPVIQQFKNAIVLLSCQPQSSKDKRGRRGSELLGGSVIGSTQSILSQVSIESIVGNEFDEVINAIEMHDKERWLALRAKGGNSKRAFLCIR